MQTIFSICSTAKTVNMVIIISVFSLFPSYLTEMFLLVSSRKLQSYSECKRRPLAVFSADGSRSQSPAAFHDCRDFVERFGKVYRS